MADTLIETMEVCGLTGPSWKAWRTVAKCLDGQLLDPDELALYTECTGRRHPLTAPPDELWLIKGRRCGGSRFGGVVTVRAATRKYDLAPGETAVIGVAAADREQARVSHNYATAPFRESAELYPLIRRPKWQALLGLVVRSTRWSLDLKTGVTIEVRTSHFGKIRGRTYALAIAEEAAFWQAEDGSNPASEVLAAIRPGLATLGGQLIVITTPYSKSGPVWDAHEKYWGVDDPRVLVWKAPSRTMNPLLSQSLVADALARDPEAARAEWLAEFRDDVSALVTHAALRAVVRIGSSILPPVPGHAYSFFTDPATGSGQDSWTYGVAHAEEIAGQMVKVVDGVWEHRPPFDPSQVVRAIAETARVYGCASVTGDAFAKGFTDELFRQVGLLYEVSAYPKSELYIRTMAMINARGVQLPDDPRLLGQFTGLQRRPTSAGRESVDHAARGHDDLANCACGAAVLAGEPTGLWVMVLNGATAASARLREPFATSAPAPRSVEQLIRDGEVAAERARQKQEDVERADRAVKRAAPTDTAAARGRLRAAIAERGEADVAADQAQQRILDAADARRMARGDGPHWRTWR